MNTQQPQPVLPAQSAKPFNITQYLIIGDIISLLLVTLVGMVTALPNLIGGYLMCLSGQLQTTPATYALSRGVNLPYFSFTCTAADGPQDVTLVAMIISFGLFSLIFGCITIIVSIVKQKQLRMYAAPHDESHDQIS